MKIRLISVGTRMPSWVKEGTTEYSKRIERDLNFSLVEVPLAKRAKNQSAEVSKAKEGVDLRAQIKPGDYVVALDVVDDVALVEVLGEVGRHLQAWRNSGPKRYVRPLGDNSHVGNIHYLNNDNIDNDNVDNGNNDNGNNDDGSNNKNDGSKNYARPGQGTHALPAPGPQLRLHLGLGPTCT